MLRRIIAVIAAVSVLVSGAVAAGDAGRYRLTAGDRLEIQVHGHERLTTEATLDGTGAVSLALVGEVRLAGLTAGQAAERIAGAYERGYLDTARVSVRVLNHRPVFVLGEVEEPGRYDYERGLTVLQAVALAGGYSYRADPDDITVVRGRSGKRRDAGETTRLLPGDTVRVGQRFF
ncbi:polysaccharide export outer membrane protein [Limimonas halophila]|uniref:Polysaccharide export outer membrane protein n=1 Tax=Limimonas halophila TaxID=1082479 RepID=A0A1G7RX21_9PROT|nr:polysaccharide biosynthesis/export family protein [Limimonas halophila]SDG15308.1 polysaccharide export outer membrane protein [Limimonas halophila]